MTWKKLTISKTEDGEWGLFIHNEVSCGAIFGSAEKILFHVARKIIGAEK